MKPLHAKKLYWPKHGYEDMYYVEKEVGYELLNRQQLIEAYGIELLEILESEGEYTSPTQPKEQLRLEF